MIVTIEWDGNLADRAIPIQDLIDQVFGSQGGFNASVVRLLPLSGGESGAAVLRAIVKSPHSRVPYVLKCGYERLIEREKEAYRRWSDVTTLWNGAPPHTPAQTCLVEQEDHVWSAILYKLAGTTGTVDDLISLEDCVRAFTAGRGGDPDASPPWGSLFRTLAKSLASAYETAGPDLPVSRLLSVPIKPLRAILSSVTAVSSDVDAQTSRWSELSAALAQWENYVDTTRRDVRTTVCHGDLRGANVLVNGDTHHPFLIDFGSVGISSPIMDLARLEVDLIIRAGHLDENQIPRAHEMLFDEYDNPEWATSPMRIVQVVHHLRTAFQRVIYQGLDAGGSREEIRLFHACRVVTAAKMLRWSDEIAASRSVRRHLLWFVLEGIRRVVGNIGQAEGGLGMRALPRSPGPIVRQAETIGLTALHHADDWPSRNRAKATLLDSPADVWLMSHSGWSFLAPEGALFAAMQERVAEAREGRRGRTRILLGSPYTEEGVTRAVQQAPHARDLDDLAETRTFTRFTRCLTDFRTMLWRAEENAVVELRICPFSIGSAILVGGDEMFYEPYNAGLASLRDRVLQAFPEFQFTGGNGARYVTAVTEQLSWFWDRSMDEAEFRASEPELREHAALMLESLTRAPRNDR